MALEVYSFFDAQCVNHQGAIVFVDDFNVVILNLDGEIQTIPIASVKYLALYNLLENPFAAVGMEQNKDFIFEVTSATLNEPVLAYAVQFTDDMVLFLDNKGQVHVVDFKDIIALRKIAETELRPTPNPINRVARLVPPPGKESCVAASGKNTASQQYPVVSRRIYADNFQIDAFLQHMRRGYQDLNSLEERTFFYAKPILFDQKNRLGINTYIDRYARNLNLRPHAWAVPFYFRTGSGEAYRFQNAFAVGNQSWNALPRIEPVPALQTEFKSHLIHGQLIANLSGFAAGKPLVSQRFRINEDDQRKELWLYGSFNHLTLLGIDYGHWRVSFGSFFQTMAVGKKAEFREAYAPRASFLTRLGYQNPRWKFELFFFNTDYAEKIDEDETADDADHFTEESGNGSLNWYSRRFVPKDFSVSSQTLRFNSQFIPNESLVLQSDVLFSMDRYRETAFRRNEPIPVISEGKRSNGGGGLVANKISQQDVSFRLLARRDLGQWAAISGSAYFSFFNTQGAFAENPSEGDAQLEEFIFTYMAALELLL